MFQNSRKAIQEQPRRIIKKITRNTLNLLAFGIPQATFKKAGNQAYLD